MNIFPVDQAHQEHHPCKGSRRFFLSGLSTLRMPSPVRKQKILPQQIKHIKNTIPS